MCATMPIFAIIVIALAALFGALALWALGWAISSGQFNDFGAGARSIFDDEEPVGRPTDAFPNDRSAD